jgi:hypothetical protein
MVEINMKSVALSLNYLPSLEWFAVFLSSDHVFIDIHEHYLKQSYRNRCHILSANGKLALSIPVKKLNTKEAVKDIQLENDFNWQSQHWDAICSAYNSSPFIFYYKDYFEPLFKRRYSGLMEWNITLLDLCLKLLKIDKQYTLSAHYIEDENALDYRNSIHPKIHSTFNSPSYLQVFTEKYPFHPNLSIIDLLFNEGNAAKQYLLALSENINLKK